jgi:two-component system chemotaxis response regulator CheB
MLQQRCSLPVREAEDKVAIEQGTVSIAPPDYHLLVEPDHLSLSLEEPVRFSRPSIDVLFESAARAFDGALAGVVLTGANDDGADGLVAIKRAGGITIVQDPATASSPTMPEAAIRSGAADKVLPLEDIAPFLVELCTTT